MSTEDSQSDPGTQPSSSEEGAGAGPMTNGDLEKMIARAHYDFIARIHERIQPKTLAPDAQPFVECFFVQTVEHAIRVGVDWDHDRAKRRYALRRLGEIAEFAAFTAPGNEVSCGTLKSAADTFIPIWRPICPVRPFVFCENYVEGFAEGSCPCAPEAPGGAPAQKSPGSPAMSTDLHQELSRDLDSDSNATGGSAGTLDDVIQRAHDAFFTQIYETIHPKTLAPECLPFIEKLFDFTLKTPIQNHKVDWDHDGPKRRYSLRRLGEIAEYAAAASAATDISCGELKAAADKIILMWKDVCKEKLRVMEYVFCEGYTTQSCTCDAPPPAAGHQGGNKVAAE